MADPLSILGAAVAGIDAAKYLLKVIQALDDIRGSDEDYIAFDRQLRSLADSLLLAATFAKSIDNEEGRVAVFSAIQPCFNEVREALERIDGFNPFSKGDRKQRKLLKVRWYGSRKEEAEKYRQKIERLSVQLILAIVLCQFNYSNRRVPHVATEETGSTPDTMKTSLESLHGAAGLNRSELESLIFLVEQNRPALIELLQSVTSIAESSDKQISQVSALMTLIERQSSSLASLSVGVGQLISRQDSLERLLKDCFVLLRRLGAVDDLTATTLAVISRDNGISPAGISLTQAFRSGVRDIVRRVSVSWNASWKGLTGYFFTPQPGRSLPSLLIVLSLDGQPIKIPPEYPTTLEAVRDYLLVHFKHRKELPGQRFIQSGRYELSSRDSGQVLTDADDWDRHLLQSADLVMVEVEMGAVLSRRTEPTIGECPACGTVYRNHRAEDAWVECVNKYCGTRYHISKVDDSDSENRFEEIADAEVDLESGNEATQPKPLAPPPVYPQDAAQPDNSSTALAIGQKRSASSAGLLDLQNDLKRIRKIHVKQISVLLKEVSKLDPNTAPPDMKIEGNGWSAVFQNHKAKQSLGMRLVHSFEHESVVACARFSPDGRYLATGCNHTAQIYDVMTGLKTCVLVHETSPRQDGNYIRDLRFTPEGDYLTTAAEDKVIRMWDYRSHRIHARYEGHQQMVYSIDISRDGGLLVSGSKDGTVRIWSLADGSHKELLAPDFDSHVDQDIISVDFSPDGRLVVAAQLEAIIRVWDTATGALLAQLRGHMDSVYSVAFTPDGRGIISGSLDCTVKCWDVQAAILPTRGGEEGKSCRTTYTGPSNYVFNVAVSEDGRWIMGGSKDCKAWLWDMKTGTTQFLLAGHKNTVLSVDFCPKTSLFVTGSSDCTARIWDYGHV